MEGQTTSLAPGLLFLLRSPATFVVKDSNGTIFTEQDGILVIPNATDGTYQATLTGTDTGTYHFTIGQFTDSTTKWIEMENTISPGAKNQYNITFQAKSPLDMPITNMSFSDWLNQIDLQITQLSANQRDVRKLHIAVEIARLHFKKRNNFIVKIQLENLLSELSDVRERTSSSTIIQQTLDIGKSIQFAYIALFSPELTFFPEHIRIPQKNGLERKNNDRKYSIEQKLNQKKLSQTQLLLYQEAQNNYQIAQTAFMNKEYTKAYIYFYQAKLLFEESVSPSFFKAKP